METGFVTKKIVDSWVIVDKLGNEVPAEPTFGSDEQAQKRADALNTEVQFRYREAISG